MPRSSAFLPSKLRALEDCPRRERRPWGDSLARRSYLTTPTKPPGAGKAKGAFFLAPFWDLSWLLPCVYVLCWCDLCVPRRAKDACFVRHTPAMPNFCLPSCCCTSQEGCFCGEEVEPGTLGTRINCACYKSGTHHQKFP